MQQYGQVEGKTITDEIVHDIEISCLTDQYGKITTIPLPPPYDVHVDMNTFSQTYFSVSHSIELSDSNTFLEHQILSS